MKRMRLMLAEVACACLLVFFAVTDANAYDCNADCYNGNDCGGWYGQSSTFANVGLCGISATAWDMGEYCSSLCGCSGMSSGPPPCMD